MKKLLRFFAGLLSVPAFFSCAVFAAFQYARSPAPSGESTVEISLNAFYYGDYPADFPEAYREVIELALSTEAGGLNHPYSSFLPIGFGYWVSIWPILGLNSNAKKQYNFGYVGSMDPEFGSGLNVPDNVSAVMTLPNTGVTGNDVIYLYVIALSAEELASKSKGEVIGNEDGKPLYRITFEKNENGSYESTNFVKGTSVVTEYESGSGQTGINGFAVYNDTEEFVPV